MGDITDLMDVILSKFQAIVKDREAWYTAFYGVTKSQTRFSNCTTTATIDRYDKTVRVLMSIFEKPRH